MGKGIFKRGHAGTYPVVDNSYVEREQHAVMQPACRYFVGKLLLLSLLRHILTFSKVAGQVADSEEMSNCRVLNYGSLSNLFGYLTIVVSELI